MMNNPKVFLTALLILSFILVLLVLTLPTSHTSSIKGVVVSQTVTQSLDGRRRYLNVQLDTGQTTLVTAPIASDCPEGSIITLHEERSSLHTSGNYRFFSCLPHYK
ncbi:hypothetical protein [Vibrio sp. VPAP30]|uniref:hypothetical protein n=1 Tax=Vibrio sp. VPAP30 TaxID=1647102 RepID=UPI000B16E65D|nr:hypothetical protein [Vibrio sp. VPAP30]